MKLHQSRKSPGLAWAKAFLKDERGQSTTEYILILSVVVMIAMKFKSVFSQQLMSAVGKLGNDIGTVVDENASSQ